MKSSPTTPPAPPPAGPKQKRSLRSQEQILSATERLLEREGANDFTLLDLSRESGISVGGIYRRFVDKDGLLQVLQQRVNEKMLDEFDAFVEETGKHATSLEQHASTLIGGMADMLKRHAPVLRKIVEVSASNPVLAEHGVRVYRAHFTLFRRELLKYRDAIRHDDPEYAIEFCFHTAYELIASHFGFARRGTIHDPVWERLVDNLQRLGVNYLAGPG